jgi:hypothetical protein
MSCVGAVRHHLTNPHLSSHENSSSHLRLGLRGGADEDEPGLHLHQLKGVIEGGLAEDP